LTILQARKIESFISFFFLLLLARYEDMTGSTKDDYVNLTVRITKIADNLLREHIRHKGDLSRIINGLILKEYLKIEKPKSMLQTST
jgi:hypothetical protein